METQKQGYVIECNNDNVRNILIAVIRKKGGEVIQAGSALFTDYVFTHEIPLRVLRHVVTREFANEWEYNYWHHRKVPA